MNDSLDKAIGLFEEEKYSESIKIFERLAEQNDSVAQYYLGHFFSEGLGVPENSEAAVNFYMLSANQGYAPAQETIGGYYIDGPYLHQNFREAAKWLMLSAEQGEPMAQMMLGLLFAKGQGVPKDLVIAYMWIYISLFGFNKELSTFNKVVLGHLGILESQMPQEQTETAKALAHKWHLRAC